ncbi:hypothetical protein [Candidatus Protochlamydia naegleriophila]|nr:hypothetical protein [Candidatus Protochlamydia naegleriophila]
MVYLHLFITLPMQTAGNHFLPVLPAFIEIGANKQFVRIHRAY